METEIYLFFLNKQTFERNEDILIVGSHFLLNSAGTKKIAYKDFWQQIIKCHSPPIVSINIWLIASRKLQ